MESSSAEKKHQEGDDPPAPLVQLKGIPAKHNDKLTEFFSATFVRTRIYWLLASLARHQSIRTANAMAFDLFLALIPTLGLAGWAAALFVGSESGTAFQALFHDLTPYQINELIGHHFEALAAAHLAPLAALAGLWLSSSAFNTMIGVFQEAFDCHPRHWIQARLIALGLAFLGMGFLGMASGLSVTLAVIVSDWGHWFPLKAVGLSSVVGLFGALCLTAFLSLLYRVSIRRPGKKRVTWPGAVAATFIGVLASVGLGYYAAHLARYTLFYGSLAAIVVALFWLWLWSAAILIGAEINVAMEDVTEARKTNQRAAVESPANPTHSPSVLGNSGGD